MRSRQSLFSESTVLFSLLCAFRIKPNETQWLVRYFLIKVDKNVSGMIKSNLRSELENVELQYLGPRSDILEFWPYFIKVDKRFRSESFEC
jgi:hypothetical protein